MSVAASAPTTTGTEHGLLLPLGRFAGEIGLTAAFAAVPFKMKTLTHRPAEKLAEFAPFV